MANPYKKVRFIDDVSTSLNEHTPLNIENGDNIIQPTLVNNSIWDQTKKISKNIYTFCISHAYIILLAIIILTFSVLYWVAPNPEQTTQTASMNTQFVLTGEHTATEIVGGSFVVQCTGYTSNDVINDHIYECTYEPPEIFKSQLDANEYANSICIEGETFYGYYDDTKKWCYDHNVY